MALIAGKPWGSVARPWGWEVRVDFTDDATGTIYARELGFPAEPSAEALAASVASARVRLEAELAPPVPPPAEYRITCDDGTVIEV